MPPTNPRTSQSGQRARSVGFDPAIAEMVRQGIKVAQEKLIDLSQRNTMLNFRHSETSARHVRLIDERLDFLVKSLSANRTLDVIPLPPVEQVPADEDTDEFRAALKKARDIDPEWLAVEDARRAAGDRRRNRDRAAERALRDRVRAQRGMKEWRAAIDPKARAAELRIDPSYDLPPADRPMEKRHTDSALQTLFFPDRLEAKLSSIHSSARALQEDAGLSALYCAVGFLEWYEQEDSPDPSFAPILLLPINMQKRIVSGEYVFTATS